MPNFICKGNYLLINGTSSIEPDNVEVNVCDTDHLPEIPKLKTTAYIRL